MKTTLKSHGHSYGRITHADSTPAFISARSSFNLSGRLFYRGNIKESAMLYELFSHEQGLKSNGVIDNYLYNELRLPHDMDRVCVMISAMLLPVKTEAALNTLPKNLIRKTELSSRQVLN